MRFEPASSLTKLPPHTSKCRSDGQQWGSFKEAGLDSLREGHRVNGQVGV
jgi:hypothetical protein